MGKGRPTMGVELSLKRVYTAATSASCSRMGGGGAWDKVPAENFWQFSKGTPTWDGESKSHLGSRGREIRHRGVSGLEMERR